MNKNLKVESVHGDSVTSSFLTELIQMKTCPHLLMSLLQAVDWVWVGALLTPFSRVSMFMCTSEGVNAAVSMSPSSPLKRAPLFVLDWGGSHSVSAFWAFQPAQPPWGKLFSSDHRRQLANTQWFAKVSSVFVVFLSQTFTVSVKLLIFFPPTERFHGAFRCYLHVYGENCNLWVIWEISTVWVTVI